MDARAAHAMIRFGLGRRGGEPVPADPHAWLAGQLDAPDPGLAAPVHTSVEALAAVRLDRMIPPAPGQPRRAAELWGNSAASMASLLFDAEAPLRERLVWFWANHFSISLRRGELHVLALPYLQEAIRPHVTGHFHEMLLAVMRHPAMLMYLDNTESFGPDSPAGLRTRRGLNENLARECLELHTVTPAAGYSQRDVSAFAQVLTGWGIGGDGEAPSFRFYPQRHQPGVKAVMGQNFPAGEAGGVAALAWLGRHPASFQTVAAKLVRHFVADEPASADVERIAAVLRLTGGNLKLATLELLRLPAAWQPLTKLRAPDDYAVAVVRALDLAPENRPDLQQLLRVLGKPLMSAPLPNGWPDSAAIWSDGELLLRRADWAVAVTARVPDLDPLSAARNSLGDLLGEPTRLAMQRAPSRREALALLLASPEFMRR